MTAKDLKEQLIEVIPVLYENGDPSNVKDYIYNLTLSYIGQDITDSEMKEKISRLMMDGIDVDALGNIIFNDGDGYDWIYTGNSLDLKEQNQVVSAIMNYVQSKR